MHKLMIFFVFILCTYIWFGNIKLKLTRNMYGQIDVSVRHQFDAKSGHQFDVDS